MIDYESYAKIRNLLEQKGLNYSQIADDLGLDHRTVKKWAEQKRYQKRKDRVYKSKLDPFKGNIFRLLEKYPYSAAQIHQRITSEGFKGGYSIVKEYVSKVRPPKMKAFLKLVFAPGECAQVDWGSFGSVRVGENTYRRLSFFVMVLCYSRMMYVEFTVSQTMEHFLSCHQNAFAFFGRVPKKIMVDNLKSAVLRRIVGKAPVFNPKYLDFANYTGFAITPCAVGKANEKGRVESGVGYVKKNLLAGLDIPEFAVMAPITRNWLDTVANVRIHKETGKRPVEMFQEEKIYLQTLPVHPYDIATISQMRATRQFRIALDGNSYSVPAELAGIAVNVKVYPDRVCIYHENNLVARHVRSYERRKDFELPDHPKALLEMRRKARDQKIFMRFLSLSGNAQEYYRQLKERRLNPLHHIRQIVALSEIYSPEKVSRAIDDAFALGAFSCEYIVNLLEQRSKIIPESSALHLTRRQDLLDLDISEPDLTLYNLKEDTHG
jgi:transposase